MTGEWFQCFLNKPIVVFVDEILINYGPVYRGTIYEMHEVQFMSLYFPCFVQSNQKHLHQVATAKPNCERTLDEIPTSVGDRILNDQTTVSGAKLPKLVN